MATEEAEGLSALQETPTASIAAEAHGMAAEGAEGLSPLQAEQLTKPGMTMGTIAYMSPEQARGEEVDARTDLFSFGAVLYEMATGKNAFSGSTSRLIIDAILHKAPVSPRRLNPELPVELERVVDKTLEKDREARYQTASELRADLKRLKHDTESGRWAAVPAVARLRRPHAVVVGGAVLAALVLIGLAAWLHFHPSHRTASALRIVPFTSFPGEKGQPAFSPDGNAIAFVWQGESDASHDIYVKQIGPGTPLRLTANVEVHVSPAWSPDGRFIAFFRPSPTGGRTTSSHLSAVPSASWRMPS